MFADRISRARGRVGVGVRVRVGVSMGVGVGDRHVHDTLIPHVTDPTYDCLVMLISCDINLSYDLEMLCGWLLG